MLLIWLSLSISMQLWFCCYIIEDTWLCVCYSFPLYRFCYCIFEVPLTGSSDSSIFCQLFRSSCCLAAKSCPTGCNPMDCSTPGFPVFHRLLEYAQTHVHWVSDAIQPFSSSVVPFSSCLQSFPASESFPMSQLLESSGHGNGALQLQHQSFPWIITVDFL